VHDAQIEETLREFETLAQLRGELQAILASSVGSLEAFYSPGSGGFVHRLDLSGGKHTSTHWSKSSTATCLAFLHATGLIGDGPWSSKRHTLRGEIVSSDWDSAELGPGNPFTVAFLLEALADLGGRASLSMEERVEVNKRVASLRKAMRKGGIALQDGFEPTAFLTYKAVCAIKRWGGLDDRGRLEDWNWNHLHKESALVCAQSNDADVFEVAYSVLIANALRPLDEMSPQQRLLLGHGLKQFFAAMRPDGTWPRSRPLFVYPKLGHAYCFEYELLAAMLAEAQLGVMLQTHLDALRLAAQALDVTKYPLESSPGGRPGAPAPYGWSSGHHGTDSWSTAAALHFCFGLSELVAEAIRRVTFTYADAPYTPPRAQKPLGPFLGKADFLDSPVRENGKPRERSLRRIIRQRFLTPLVAERDAPAKGRKISKQTATAAIFYGPPGTSKTQLTKLLAEALGWPFLALDPSHLTRRGRERVHAEANTIFRMLEHCERIVVLLDEFDELMRDRDSAGELESRFLTTAMLPKLAALSSARRLVYVVATNHIEQFDAAIRRPGRFDLVVPVMPPKTAEKLAKWPALAMAVNTIAAHNATAGRGAQARLHDLTYLEAEELADQITAMKSTTATKLMETIDTAAGKCTLSQKVSPTDGPDPRRTSWKEQIAGQADRIRGT
jgi:hypothetical protein